MSAFGIHMYHSETKGSPRVLVLGQGVKLKKLLSPKDYNFAILRPCIHYD